MDVEFVERKVNLLGSWKSPRFNEQSLADIKDQINTKKGSKVKLTLSAEGIRYQKAKMLQGKMLVDYIPMPMLKFFSIARTNPDVLFIVSVLLHDPQNNRFKIDVFRCSNGMDASLFATAFTRLSAQRQSVKLVRTQAPRQLKEGEINWTLRSKEADNSKRELRQYVDINGGDEPVVTTTIENGDKAVVPNGHTEVYDHGVRIPIYRKGRPTRIESDADDNKSESSESVLRMELESLSHEIREIKMMLENQNGMTTSSESSASPREGERPVNVAIHKHVVNPAQVVVYRQKEPAERVETIVMEDNRPRSSGYTVTTEGSTTHVRVSVPDYRTIAERTSTTVPASSFESRAYEVVKTTRPSTASTTTYESWKQNTLERSAVRQFNDVPERIQWRSAPKRSTHVVSATARPRSALPSWSTDTVDGQRVEIRHHNAGLGPAYGRVSFNPRAAKLQERKTQSLRGSTGLSLSSTVVKPIDRVYVGRADAKHHSLSGRGRVAVRPSIVVRDIDIENTPDTLYVEQNNNVVKHEDEQLLDVSGIDLYKETPTDGAVIRT